MAETGFDWDDFNRDHVEDHGVSDAEAEQAYGDPARKPAPAYTSVSGEARRAITGATLAGRVLYVVCTVREHRVRIVTARDATKDERSQYRAKKGRKK